MALTSVAVIFVVNNVYQLWTCYFSLSLSLSEQKHFKNIKTTMSLVIKIHIFILLLHVFGPSNAQVDSGSFSGDRQPEPIRPGGVFVLGQDQVGISYINIH